MKVIDDGDALFGRHPKVVDYDDYYVTCMLYDAKRGQTGIGYVVNAITWFNLLWLNRASIVAELRRMQPSSQVAAAIRWMEQELPRSRMPMVASRGDATRRRRLPWVVGSDLSADNTGEDWLYPKSLRRDAFNSKGVGCPGYLVPHFRDELLPTNLRALFFISIYAGLNAVKTPRRCTPSG